VDDAARVRRAIWLSLLLGLLVLGVKWVAYRVTGSVALFSDALESIVNVVAAGGAVVAVHYSRLPPDEDHPFGHSKAEYLSAVVEGVLIALAAIAIGVEAVPRLVSPRPVDAVGAGIAVAMAATLVNGLLAAHLVRVGRLQRSPALTADGLHLFSDVVTTVGAVSGIALAWATGWWLLDPLLALLVALNILRVGGGLLWRSVGGLLDTALPAEERERIEAVLRENMSGALEIHDLRTRQAGWRSFAVFHLVVPGDMAVEEAHRICDRMEAAVEEAWPGCHVTVHVEPHGEAKHRGIRR